MSEEASLPGQSDSRKALLDAARECFSRRPYQQVTTRSIATKAGVNAAMISYYFVNKEGLYSTMLSDVAREFDVAMTRFVNAYSDNPFEGVMRAQAYMAEQNPLMPRLIFTELAFNDGKGRQLMLDNVAAPNRAVLLKVFKQLESQNRLRGNFDPMFLMISTISLSVFTQLLEDVLVQLEGKPMTAERKDLMIRQFADLLQYGCLQTRPENPD